MSQFNKISEFEDCYSLYVPNNQQRNNKVSQVQEVFEETCEVIDRIAKEVEAKKFKKVAQALLNFVSEELLQQGQVAYELAGQQYYNLKIKFVYLQVDHGEEKRVQDFYSELIKLKAHRADLKGKSMKIEYERDRDKPSFITTSIEFSQIQQEQEYQQIMTIFKNQFKQTVDSYLTILLLQNQMSLEQINDLKKMIQEDVQLKVESRESFYHTIIFIIPASDQEIGTFEMNGIFDKKYYFTDPQNVMIRLLFNLIKETQIPLLSYQVYKLILADFNTYLTSFKEELNLIKSAYFIFYHEKSKDLKQFQELFSNKQQQDPVFHKYLQLRDRLRSSIELIQLFIKNMKRHVDNVKLKGFKMKLINLLSNQKQYSTIFQLSKDENYQQLLDLFLRLDSSDKNVQNYINNVELYISEQKQQTSDRVGTLLHKDSIQDRFQDYLNLFVKYFIIDIHDEIAKKYSQYMFGDLNLFYDYTQPDVLEKYHKIMKTQSSISHVRNTQQLYANIGKKGVNVPISEVYDEEDNQFFYSVTELKLLGLIQDTKKQKPTFQRHYFAKQVFANYIE